MSHDLILLAADLDIETVLRALLGRRRALGIRPIQADFLRHPQRDNGCCDAGDVFLRPFSRLYRHALVVFDHEGSGHSHIKPADIERQVERRLARAGWEDSAAAVVISPEFEAWVWSDSPHVERALGWHNRRPGLRAWLKDQGYVANASGKPLRPKEAVEAAMRAARVPRSPGVFGALAEKISLRRCRDRAFLKLCKVLSGWFPEREQGHDH